MVCCALTSGLKADQGVTRTQKIAQRKLAFTFPLGVALRFLVWLLLLGNESKTFSRQVRLDDQVNLKCSSVGFADTLHKAGRSQFRWPQTSPELMSAGYS